MQIIAILGADGSGKTTQAQRLVRRLTSEGFRARYIRPAFMLFDPWKGDQRLARAISPRMRRLAIDHGAGSKRLLASLGSALAKLAGYPFAVVSYGLLRARSRKEQFVVCDRFFYQYFFDLYGPRSVRLAVAFPRPDLPVWLDASPETLRDRLARLPDSKEDQLYLTGVDGVYRELSREIGFCRIDASLGPDAVGDAVWRVVLRGTEA